jgi:hypothetical protein
MKSLMYTLLLTVSAAGLFAASPALEERFDYKTENALRERWTRVTNAGSQAGLGKDKAVNGGQPYAVFANNLYRCPLKTPVGGSWKVSFDVLHSDPRRGTWLGLFDATGQHGYAVMWDSGNPAGGIGNGSVSLRKFDLVTPVSDWMQLGEALGKTHDSGHVINREPFAHFEFTRDGSTGRLTVSVDGQQILSYVDKAFTSFADLYLRGNQFQYYANIVVEDTSSR